MAHTLKTPRPGLFALPTWLRQALTRRSAANTSIVATTVSPAEAERRVTDLAMLAGVANGFYAAFSMALHLEWISRQSLGFIFPSYHFVGTALFGIMIGCAFISSNRRAQFMAWASIGMMATLEILDALSLPTPPWALSRIPFILLFLGIPALWFVRRLGSRGLPNQ